MVAKSNWGCPKWGGSLRWAPATPESLGPGESVVAPQGRGLGVD